MRVRALSDMRLIIIGSTGFIGGEFKRRAEEEGLPVVTVQRSTVSAPGGQTAPHDATARGLADVLGRCDDAVVVNCAGFNSPADAAGEAEAVVDGNFRFPYQVLEAARANGGKRFVNLGSFWQFDASGEARPVNAYAAMKGAFQSVLDYAADAHAMRCVTLILSDTYSERDTRMKFLNAIKAAARDGVPLDMTDGYQCVSLLHLDDLLDALLQAVGYVGPSDASASDGPEGFHRVFFATGAEPVSVRRIVDILREELNVDVDARWGARARLARLPERPFTDGPRLPGWSPRVTLREGLRRVFAERTER